MRYDQAGQTAEGRWHALHNIRQGFITRCERYAGYTVRKLCLPEGYDQNTTELNRDYNSLGAQLVNNLSNKVMLALFAPSRPFYRYDVPPSDMEQFARATKLTEPALQEMLALAEARGVRQLDTIAARPKLYEAVRHLIVTGNALLELDPKGEEIRVMGIKQYCVKRSSTGRVLEILIYECIKQDELAPDIQKYCTHTSGDAKVNLYRWIRWDHDKKKYAEEYWVGAKRVDDKKYIGTYTDDTLPYRALTWDLSDEADYGTGLVEEYQADFQSLSTLSEAEVNGAILASEFRWLANPMGITKVADVQNSRNGAVLPGAEGDLVLVSAGNVAANVQVVTAVALGYIRRLGAGFLLNSAVTRDAERVTAEEIRLQAQELESSLGGVYSRIAVDMQRPIAMWLTRIIDFNIAGTGIKPVIVTGMDALSRNGDLENLRLFLQDVVTVTSLPEIVLMYLKLSNIFSKLAAGRGLKSSEVVNSPEEVAAQQKQMQDQALQQQQTLEATKAGAKAATQPQ